MHILDLFEAKTFKKAKFLAQVSDKLLARVQRDRSINVDSVEAFIDAIEQPLLKENKLQIIFPYLKWIIARYIEGDIALYEDIMSKAVPALITYDLLKRKKKLQPEHTDINRIKKYLDLSQMVRSYEEAGAAKPTKGKSREREFYAEGDADLVYDDKEIKIVTPKTEEASCFFGRNTEWCTAATKSANLFDSYNSRGPLYILLIKHENTRYQFHFETGQLMDENDHGISWDVIEDLRGDYPILYEVINRWPFSNDNTEDMEVVLIENAGWLDEVVYEEHIPPEIEAQVVMDYNPNQHDLSHYTPSQAATEILVKKDAMYVSYALNYKEYDHEDEEVVDDYMWLVKINPKAITEILDHIHWDDAYVKIHPNDFIKIIDANPDILEYIDLDKVDTKVMQYIIENYYERISDLLPDDVIRAHEKDLEKKIGPWPTIQDERQLDMFKTMNERDKKIIDIVKGKLNSTEGVYIRVGKTIDDREHAQIPLRRQNFS